MNRKKLQKYAMKVLPILKNINSTGAKRLMRKNTTYSVPRDELTANHKRTIIGVRVSDWKREFLMKVFPDYNWVFLGFKVKVESMKPLIDELDNPIFLFWGYNEFPQCLDFVKAGGYPLWRMEDGFIRSLGLGAHHNLPMSLVLDRSGTLYFDPREPSTLESLISKESLTEHEVEKASRLMTTITTQGISKYNSQLALSGSEYYDSFAPKKEGQKRILVIGQVEDDASIRLGGCGHTNGSLVYEARMNNPDAQIFFKPHPDVLAGKREIETPLSEIENVAHIIENNMSLASSFESIDEVYVISSLAGFEALLHDKPVTVLGQPFYASWGLTNDINPNARRLLASKGLPDDKQDRLRHVFGMTYLRYPKYFNTLKQCPSNIDEAIFSISTAVKLREEKMNHLMAEARAKSSTGVMLNG